MSTKPEASKEDALSSSEKPQTCQRSVVALHLCYLTLVILQMLTLVVIIPVIFQMVIYSFCCIYIGSHLSLKLKDCDPITGEPKLQDAMTSKDAMLFPFIGSASLGSLYIAYKFLSPEIVNKLLTLYLTVLGVAAVAATIQPFIQWSLGKKAAKQYSITIPAFFPLNLVLRRLRGSPGSKGKAEEAPPSSSVTGKNDAGDDGKVAPLVIEWDMSDAVSYSTSAILAAIWLMTKHWSLHNLLAISFSIQMISMVSLGNFKVASILLCGLFVYDIFWVFGTDVMVTVAKNFEGPAKLIFPVSFSPWRQSILGLGDIVVPGFLIAMCLRLDEELYHRKKQRLEDKEIQKNDNKATSSTEAENGRNGRKGKVDSDINASFSKIYFLVNIAMYCAGLVTTGFVMFFFKAAQPALLYLVPFCLAGLFGTAVVRKQLNDVWMYTENDDDSTKAVPDAAKSDGGVEASGKAEIENKKDQ